MASDADNEYGMIDVKLITQEVYFKEVLREFADSSLHLGF